MPLMPATTSEWTRNTPLVPPASMVRANRRPGRRSSVGRGPRQPVRSRRAGASIDACSGGKERRIKRDCIVPGQAPVSDCFPRRDVSASVRSIVSSRVVTVNWGVGLPATDEEFGRQRTFEGSSETRCFRRWTFGCRPVSPSAGAGPSERPNVVGDDERVALGGSLGRRVGPLHRSRSPLPHTFLRQGTRPGPPGSLAVVMLVGAAPDPTKMGTICVSQFEPVVLPDPHEKCCEFPRHPRRRLPSFRRWRYPFQT